MLFSLINYWRVSEVILSCRTMMTILKMKKMVRMLVLVSRLIEWWVHCLGSTTITYLYIRFILNSLIECFIAPIVCCIQSLFHVHICVNIVFLWPHVDSLWVTSGSCTSTTLSFGKSPPFFIFACSALLYSLFCCLLLTWKFMSGCTNWFVISM